MCLGYGYRVSVAQSASLADHQVSRWVHRSEPRHAQPEDEEALLPEVVAGSHRLLEESACIGTGRYSVPARSCLRPGVYYQRIGEGRRMERAGLMRCDAAGWCVPLSPPGENHQALGRAGRAESGIH